MTQNLKHSDPLDLVHPEARALQRVLGAHGGHVYEVGGRVRDGLLGLESKDLDCVVTGVNRETLEAALAFHLVDFVGASFGVYKVQLRDWGGEPGETIDLALPRVEVSSGAGHRDFVVDAGPHVALEADLSRRDFTVNALARSAWTGTLVDPFNGQRDLATRRLRFVGDPDGRIQEDPLRLLRAYRFMGKLGLTPVPRTRAALRRHAGLVRHLPHERVWAELWTLLSYDHVAADTLVGALEAMLDDGALEHVLPGYGQTRGLDQMNPHHDLTLSDHLLASVGHTQRLGAGPAVKLAALMHDLGKPQTMVVGEDGVAHYLGHEEAGAGIAAGHLTRLRAPNSVRDAVVALVRHHMRPELVSGDRGLRRFMHDLGELWPDALTLRAADRLAHRARVDDAALTWLHATHARCLALNSQVAGLSDHTLALGGEELMRELGLESGHSIGVVKRALLALVVDGELPNERAALLERARELI